MASGQTRITWLRTPQSNGPIKRTRSLGLGGQTGWPAAPKPSRPRRAKNAGRVVVLAALGLRPAPPRCHHQIRKLIEAGILTSEQIMPDAPHQIRTADLESERVVAALKRKGRPCRIDSEKQDLNVSRCLKRGCRINRSWRRVGSHVRPDCCRGRYGHHLHNATESFEVAERGQ